MDAPAPAPPSTEPPSGGRAPSDLVWVGLASVLLGVQLGTRVAAIEHAGAQVARALLAAAAVVAGLGLLRMRPWARRLGAVTFAVFAVDLGRRALAGPSSFGAGVVAAFAAYCALYLGSASTARVFARAGARGGVTLVGLAPYVAFAGLCAALALAPGPDWARAAGAVALILGALALEGRLTRLAARWLGPRPDDLPAPAVWARFREARDARDRGDLDRAAALAAELPPSRSAVALRGLIDLDRARRAGGLRRLVLDHGWEPGPDLAPALADELRTADVPALVAARSASIEALAAEVQDARGAFAYEADAALERLTGASFVRNPEYAWEGWWAERRARFAGPGAYRWLVARAWQAECDEAAAVAGQRSGDDDLAEATGLAWLLRGGLLVQQRTSEAMEELFERLCALPPFADRGLARLDGELVGLRGPEAVARGHARRARLIEALPRLWAEHPEAASHAAWLLHVLCDAPRSALRAPPAFHRWWGEHALGWRAHDERLHAGLVAAAAGDWAAAEVAFAAALAARPGADAAAWNRALALERLDRHTEAEPLWRRLALAAPDRDEPALRLAACLERLGRGEEARALLVARAAKADRDDALAIGLRLAAGGHDDAAQAVLDRAAGDDRGRLERLAGELERQGSYGLAEHYQYAAFLRSLGGAPEDDEASGDDDDRRGPAGAS